MALPPAGNSIASLKETAIAWAHAFLVGSINDIKALQGPECAVHSGTTIPIRAANQYLRGERAVMQKYLGRPLPRGHNCCSARPDRAQCARGSD